MIAGLPATMSCIPPISEPPAYVTWYKDDALLVPRSGEQTLRIVQSSSGAWNIEFAEVQKQDEGEYFCVANNDYAVPSTRTSRVATLQVGGMKRIVIFLHDTLKGDNFLSPSLSIQAFGTYFI